jgi:uncharacterized alpha-E superfamily protein
MNSMLSRVADNLYWMSRYLERAEHTASLIDEHLNLVLDSLSITEDQRWTGVIASLGVGTLAPSEGSVAHALAFDVETRSSIVNCIEAARENARHVREQTSSAMWEQINRLFHAVRDAGVEDQWESDPHMFLTTVREGAHLFQGITDSTMNHDQGWRFIQLGRFIERAGALAVLLDVHFRAFAADRPQSHELSEHLEWIGLLKSCAAFEGYCKVYTADIRAERVAEFLLLNDVFPHSVRFCVERIHGAVQALPKGSRQATARLVRITGRLRAALNFSDIDEVISAGLHPSLENVQRQCHEIHAAIREAYIDYPIERAIGA